MSVSLARPNYELLLERHYPVAREEVFKAFTDERKLAQWFGPRGFTCQSCVLDPRSGGNIHIDLRGPDGQLYPMTGSILELSAPSRLAFDSQLQDSEGRTLVDMQQIVTCMEAPGGTLLAWHFKLKQADVDAGPYLDDHEQGSKQTLDRLGEFLTQREIS